MATNLPANVHVTAAARGPREHDRDIGDAEGLFDPNSGPPGYVYVKLVEHLTALIDSGELKPGARLLSERDLARDCGVSLGTVRRAVGVLASRGLVRVVAAEGTYVVGPVSDD